MKINSRSFAVDQSFLASIRGWQLVGQSLLTTACFVSDRK
jgi:hypothetical protein